MKSALCVWWDARLVGALEVNSHGEMSFRYTSDWLTDGRAPPLSASLPKQMEPFSRRACQPFFGGLLPEEAPRELVAKLLGISKGNTFELLKALGGDVAGALTLWLEGESPPKMSIDPQTLVEELDDARLRALLDILPSRPLMAGSQGLRLSLAGAQSKLPVVLRQGRIALPAPGMPTTHILKPPIPRFTHTTENEAFAMRLAAAIGLDVATVEPRVVDGRSFLLIARYDRTVDAYGQTHRLHQEDFCQALGVDSERKYASEGGPTFKICFELLRRVCARPAIDVLKLLDAAIFNVLIGNCDAHGKNFSLLYAKPGTALAPLYDLLSTVAYPELSPTLAMKMGKCATLTEMDASSWRKFANDAGLAAPFVQKRLLELGNKIVAHSNQIIAPLTATGLQEAPLVQLAALVNRRVRQALSASDTKVWQS